MQTTTRALVAERYPRIATQLLEPLRGFMQLARATCDGDVDKFLVLLVLCLRTTTHPDYMASTPEQLMREDVEVLPGFGTNGRSIAESLAMPKETVRRKIRALVQSGWVVRRTGHLYVTVKCFRDLGPVRAALEDLAISYYRVVRPIDDEATV